MKLRFCFLFMIIFSFSCDRDKSTQPQEMGDCLLNVHLQVWFSATPVTVYVDKYAVFEDTISTGYILPVAEVITTFVDQGSHRLGIKINNQIFIDTTFVIDDTLYVGINYSSCNSEINFRFQHEPFYYR